MNTLYVQLSADGMKARAWLSSSSGISSLGESDMASLAQRYSGHATVLFLPSSLCLFASVTASSRQLRQAGQSLAWLIEEQCGEDAENLQVIAAAVTADDQASLLAINREVLQNLLASFRGLGLRVVAAVPDLFLLTRPDVSAWQLLEDKDGRLLLRTAAFSGAVLERNLLTLMLDAALLEQEDAPTGLVAHVSSDVLRQQLQQWLTQNELSAELSDTQPEVTDHLAATTDWTRHPANFLQGSLAVGEHFSLPSGLRLAAVFLAAAFSLQLLSEWTHLAYYRYQAGKSADAAVTLYKQSHPDARFRTARPVDEVRKRLKAEGSQGGTEATTLATLTQVAESLQGSGLSTQRVDFSNGVLTLDVDARALAEIDSLRQRLDGQGLRTEIVSANAQGGLVRGRLRVEG